jgi:hypothetical protein
MAEYTFYKPDGTITVVLNCPEQELSLNLRPGEQYIEGYYNAASFQIIDGKPTPRINPHPFGAPRA